METKIQTYQQYVRPELAKVLSALKLDIFYTRAENEHLYYSKNGKEVEVYDFLGGFGSTILGHNNPEILKTVKHCIDHKIPQHTQVSLKSETADLGELLNTLVKNSLNDERNFVMTLANTGTEAVEVALKHALLQWKERRDLLVYKIKTQMVRTDKIPPEMQKKVEFFFEALENLQPVMLSMSKSFHGKTSGSVTLSSNEDYKKMFLTSPFKVKFLNWDNPDLALNIIKETDLVLNLGPQIISFSSLVGFIYEPIQGEGGIVEIPLAFMTVIAPALKNRNIPLIADEIQSGLWRTGKFLCSEWFSLKPDYILLGKSLGGGVMKISACLIARDHYLDEFGWLQTSTFSEDPWSSITAIKTLEIMEKSKDELINRAQKFEYKIGEAIESIQKKYPGIINQFRGRGFFLGIEFNFDARAPLTDLLMALYDHGHATYLYTSYLLHKHNLRVGVTLSAPEVIRIEPSAFISEKSVDQLIVGLNDLAQVLFERKILKLTAHLWDQEFTNEQLESVSDLRSIIHDSRDSGNLHVGFIAHMLTPVHIKSMDKAFEHVNHKELARFFDRYSNHTTPFRFYQQKITASDGSQLILNFYGIMQPSAYFEKSLRAQDFKALRVVQELIDLASSHQVKYLGLGGFSSIVSENGLLLNPKDLHLTTGNSVSAGMTALALKRVAKEKNLNLSKITLGVVGFAGNICNVLTSVLADDVGKLVLVNREAMDKNIKYQKALDNLLNESNKKMDEIKISHDLIDLKSCEIVVIGTNSTIEIIKSEHIGENAIVLDISLPSNVDNSVKKRSDVTYLKTGLTKLPNGQVLTHPWIPLDDGDVFACLAETLAIAFHDIKKSYSMGKITKAQVLESLDLTLSKGITLGGFGHRYSL